MILLAYVWKQLASDWNSLTDLEKENLFRGTDYNIPTGAELLSLNSVCKVLAFSEEDTPVTFVVKASPSDKLFVPVKLLGSMFDSLDNVKFTVNVSDNSTIKFAITKDLINYYTYNNGFTLLSSFDVSTVLSDGVTAAGIENISDADWDSFYGATYGDEGIAFAFAISLDSVVDVANVADLTVIADMRGEWRRAIHGTDYDYCYPANDILRVELLSDGNYKINYSMISSDLGQGN